jgi:hypothetical protein
MPENVPDQLNANPDGYDPAQAALQWMQRQLAEQGITVSPEEALSLFKQKIIYDVKRGIQQELAEQGIDVSPDEADAIDRLQFYHDLMKRFGPTDPHEAP